MVSVMAWPPLANALPERRILTVYDVSELKSVIDGSSTGTEGDFDPSDFRRDSENASSCPGPSPGVRR